MNLATIKNNQDIRNAIVFLIIIFLIIMRRPGIITNAQDGAEDGKLWLQNAYNNGIFITLFMPENGYFQTLSRLIYSIALLFGLSKAVLIANIIGVLIIASFIGFILSSRIKLALLAYRKTIAIYILLMPNIAEVYPNITNMKCRLKKYGVLRGISS